MSFFELLVVMIIALFVVKPNDIKGIISKLKEVHIVINKWKAELISHVGFESKNLDEDIEQINVYIEKIANLGMEYEGEYSLTSIKNYYHDITKDK